jgi:sterol desaturase/sphingolipid hydroxylase (fatty acid hydroxylase superfamily)
MTSLARQNPRAGAVGGAVPWVLWPALVCAGGVAQVVALSLGVNREIVFLSASVLITAVVVLLERVLPSEPRWRRTLGSDDGQVTPDLVHTVLEHIGSYGGALLSLELMEWATPRLGGVSAAIWPQSLPIGIQVIVAIFLVEFVQYWWHRFKHRVPLLWRFHSIHHSSPRLSVLNAGRGHIAEALVDAILISCAIILARVPGPVMTYAWVVINCTFALSHANIRVRSGLISMIFNTPDVHRWHHSPDQDQGSVNFGDTVMVWDLVFGTHSMPRSPAPVDVGIRDVMPCSVVGQLVAPFCWESRDALGPSIRRLQADSDGAKE